MPAIDALTVRTQFTEQLPQLMFRRAVEQFVASNNTLRDQGVTDEHMVEFWGVNAIERALAVAETYYVGPDMQQFAQMAAESFPVDEVILKEDLPSEAGFMYLPARYRQLQVHGRLMIVHAILWVNHKVWLLNDKHDLEDQINRSIADEAPNEAIYHHFVDTIGNWDMIGWINYRFGQPMPQEMRWGSASLPVNARVSTYTDNNNVVLVSDHAVDLTSGAVRRPDDLLMFLLATWRLMQQTLTTVETTTDHHPRTAIRRARRNHIPIGVTVIELRRREGHERDGVGAPIDYRYYRRGHWRRVWCGPVDGERYQRAVYIHEKICGPEGAPLIIRQKINALVR